MCIRWLDLLGTNKTAANPWIWIDYLCINQDDIEKRSHQVALMSAIFSMAMTVAAWLGKPTHGSNLVTKFIPRLGSSWTGKDRDDLME
jgi:hypothetical protein